MAIILHFEIHKKIGLERLEKSRVFRKPREANYNVPNADHEFVGENDVSIAYSIPENSEALRQDLDTTLVKSEESRMFQLLNATKFKVGGSKQ